MNKFKQGDRVRHNQNNFLGYVIEFAHTAAEQEVYLIQWDRLAEPLLQSEKAFHLEVSEFEKVKKRMLTTTGELWEILVPTVRNKRKPNGDVWPYTARYHRVWDAKVREITGGLTIMPVAKGQWVCPKGNVFKERMIPVRIMCTEEQMDQIIDLTIKYYDQNAVMATRISDRCIIRHRT